MCIFYIAKDNALTSSCFPFDTLNSRITGAMEGKISSAIHLNR